jgi:hypothetical protein
MSKKIDYASYILDRSVILFLIKLVLGLILVLLIYAAFGAYLKKIDATGSVSEKVAILYFKGIVNNPEAFYQSSLEYEKKNRYSKAIADMKFAIGLLERHSVSNLKLECYRKRLAFLEQEKLFYESF